ncbi:MAG: aminomethyl-transferring glycine dehydrogenase subunit GcvPA [Candidatus Jettenia sp.]|uniref:Probable glycine dehydrogenase (decarboxylating) subunit 1 n=1 Tax=Candidatus Jettenia caeni TaxID=247490 RepID=I3IGY9_9BACT|nr:aminomethyl-transferring glycine dehydrogenase subunit GcvPA [Candidatus Jettenia sp. AMX1]MBC6929041.1 aminomethyl-transferring glycine dehydrogenase subunit GcvPA [Candidatus Jettenia sp.]NUN23021.1 aminomethyl-transferring glycine dehydrogenase subunit GcvPA [Candidatus Jettenia caeni]KAA0249338.1 MAG: aminomethyl-transferring glycine dehydrogenase subunit GcvPA [Candidatus Jettenia sp. AMX1]MCE7881472.1 aminomethyl-transferring glycine dehydrogenase subunit GcvPA [Candidatus Jettenia sp.
MDYIPNTEHDGEMMLGEMKVPSFESLLKDIPAPLRNFSLSLHQGLSEPEVLRVLRDLSGGNISTDAYISFLGAGAYEHYIPSIVDHLASRSEFYTCYTPYQPEVSQGTLQVIYEFQTVMCELTGMDVSNASLYDGSTALAEAALLSLRLHEKNKIICSRAIHPEYRQVLKTYLKGLHTEIIEIDTPEGITDTDQLKKMADDKTSAVLIQSPNFFGCIEDMETISTIAHKQGALFIACVNPISLGVLKSPGEYDADIAVGEAQVLGNYINYGGPYLGFFTVKKEFLRRMPGRIVGETVDSEGRRCFVLTLQAREQHIRRQKATSNICTNQGLLALRACIYVCALGKTGMAELANLNIQKSHYAYERLCALNTVKPVFKTPFFHEFVLKAQGNIPVNKMNEYLLKKGIIGGLELSGFYPELDNCMLLCVTETKTKESIDRLILELSQI